VLDRLAVPTDKDIPLVDAGESAWPFAFNTHNHGARSAIPFDGDRLKTETEITAGDITVGFELCCHTVDCARGYDKNAGHSNWLSGCIENDTAFGTLPQTQTKLDSRIDLATTQWSPRSGIARHHAERSGRLTVLRAYGYDERTYSDHWCREWDRLKIGAVEPQQCDVSAWIAPN
jgi:hypothetical protein